MFENKKINEIHATRYIMSWIRSGGNLVYGDSIKDFSKWLESLGVSTEDIEHIKEIARSGKMELEYSAKEFLAKK